MATVSGAAFGEPAPAAPPAAPGAAQKASPKEPAAASAGPGITYPETQRVDHVDELHGVKVADPYRWLEEDVRTSERVAAWVKAQNAVTNAYLEAIPERARIEKRLTQMWNYERYSAPFKMGGKYFFSKNDGLQPQSVFYVQESLESEPRVLIDPNTMSKDGTVALSGLAVSDDGRYLAYGIASAGSDWNTWKVRDIATGKDTDDVIEWVKFSGAAWSTDSKGFFYSRYDAPKAGEEFQALNKFQKLYYHKLGTPQSEDRLVYKRHDQPEWGFSGSPTEDGRYLVISTWKGTDDKNRLGYVDLQDPKWSVIELVDNFENELSFVANDGPVFYFRTKLNAPLGRIIAIDTRKPEPANWKEIIPQTGNTLTGADCVNDMFVLTYLKDAITQVRMHKMDGTFVREVTFPGIGSAGGFGGKRTFDETFYAFSSFAVPPSIYRYDMKTGESKLLRRAKVDFDGDKYETRQVFYPSKDGTKIPMFITLRKGLELNGNNPVILYGYGGFNIPLTPGFGITTAAWLDMGGVYASACLRGGGEYGEKWHEAGKKGQKQNVFDDFIAAAEWLIANKYTRAERIAILGGSNGGLLVGAVVTQRPDLFGVALPDVGVMDMLRFHKFTAGRFWVDDYGSPDDAEMFKVLKGYSPYHNIKPGTRFPAMMVTTADTDDRVVPGHSFKFTAAAQAAAAGTNPVLIRIEERAGHGAGKPTAKLIELATDRFAFIVRHMGLKLPDSFK
ncbi:MAG: S9 family peptidase [Phycisphaerales bacterium]|nr:S9 family peptidase [Phycisphaerales bacterium]